VRKLSKEGSIAVGCLIGVSVCCPPAVPFYVVYLWWFFGRPDHPFYVED